MTELRSATADVGHRRYVRGWSRLMSEDQAAEYLSISATSLRKCGPKPKRLGRRVLYDRQDLDRWADRLDGQPIDDGDRGNEMADEERRFFAARSHG